MTVGTLFVVATPIGNLGDISRRAIETLGKVGVIAAEDTRVTKRLLGHLGLATPCLALHDHNEREVVPRLIERMRGGASVALVSDAGTPLISDPGFLLINAAYENAIPVVAVPGPSALSAALSIAGLPVDRFAFEGFLPAKPGERKRRLESLAAESRTLVFYESSHRIMAMLEDLDLVLGPQRQIALAHELTKVHESVERGTAKQILTWLREDLNRTKGEFVAVVAGAPTVSHDARQSDAVLSVLLEFLPTNQAVAAAGRLTGEKRNALYQRALELQKHQTDS